MIFETVRALIAEQMNIDENEITMKTHIKDDLGADSLDLLEMVMGLEEKFGIALSDDDAKSLQTVGDAVRFIENNQ